MRRTLLAGNWKMNKSISELKTFFAGIVSEVGHLLDKDKKGEHKIEVLFAVPFLQLQEAGHVLKDVNIGVAAQNVHFEMSGAFTGEVSIPMLKEVGVTTALIGHSERRQYFAETDETVMKKVAACLGNGIRPIVCIGETKEEMQSGVTHDVLRRQVSAVFGVVKDPTDLIFAYEPVWAIGTGLTATNEQAQNAHFFIRQLLTENYGAELAQKVLILYGGSANSKNICGLLQQPDIDGGLVGGASLKVEDFSAMIRSAFEMA